MKRHTCKQKNSAAPSIVGWEVGFATHKALATGLWIGAMGIFLQVVTGAKGYPKIPPGILILVAVGLLVYLTSRWVWTALLGLLLATLISMGTFATPGTAYRLQHRQNIGSLIGTVVQLVGLAVAFVAGVATLLAWYRLRIATDLQSVEPSP